MGGQLGCISTKTTHISSQTIYCWIDGLWFCIIPEYLLLIQKSHFNKFRYSYLLSWESYDLFSDDGNGRGSVGPRTTHLSSLKVDLGTDRHDSYF